MKRHSITLLLLLLPQIAAAQEDPTTSLLNQLSALEAQSPTLHAALEEVRGMENVSMGFQVGPLEENEVGRTSLLAGGGKRRAVVTIDHAQGTAARFDQGEWIITLVHEIYGHAIPYLVSGEICGDPVGEMRFQSSCVGKREAVVLEELGIRPRAVYGIRR